MKSAGGRAGRGGGSGVRFSGASFVTIEQSAGPGETQRGIQLHVGLSNTGNCAVKPLFISFLFPALQRKSFAYWQEARGRGERGREARGSRKKDRRGRAGGAGGREEWKEERRYHGGVIKEANLD